LFASKRNGGILRISKFGTLAILPLILSFLALTGCTDSEATRAEASASASRDAARAEQATEKESAAARELEEFILVMDLSNSLDFEFTEFDCYSSTSCKATYDISFSGDYPFHSLSAFCEFNMKNRKAFLVSKSGADTRMDTCMVAEIGVGPLPGVQYFENGLDYRGIFFFDRNSDETYTGFRLSILDMSIIYDFFIIDQAG